MSSAHQQNRAWAGALIVASVMLIVITCAIAADAKYRRLSAVGIRTTIIGNVVTDDARWADSFMPDSTVDTHIPSNLALAMPCSRRWMADPSRLRHGGGCKLHCRAAQPCRRCQPGPGRRVIRRWLAPRAAGGLRNSQDCLRSGDQAGISKNKSWKQLKSKAVTSFGLLA